MSPPESPATDADSDATTPANRPPFLAVVAPRISEAAALAGPLLHGAGPLVRAPHSSAPSQLRATLAAVRRPDAPLVVATDSAAAVRDADRVHVVDGGVVVESGATVPNSARTSPVREKTSTTSAPNAVENWRSCENRRHSETRASM
ncbi:hypothetical protein C456_17392 [Haloferax volcanii DSM 14919]|uniref:Uncharacterized protein n=1 Tax=Haloferax lucentense (strain DSM 14919 / JCM 9276 / NCIMB 13854 / Aa 2.2) TaxID=1230452 RepID=M0GF94_HALL2|nr:hypothetical protein [Haloferax lucentense]ELZ70207.1 hypothetical protein C456_17392 [Haloferax lucentense DSM 14919]